MEEVIEFLRRIPEVLEENRVVMLVVDGLGSLDLHIPGSRRRLLQTVFPSSTPTFLYTLHSLLRPEEHGFLEWYMRFRDSIVTIPPWEDVIKGRKLELGRDVSRDEVFPFKSLSEILTERGFSVLYYTPYAKTTFTRATSRGAKVQEIQYLSQVFPLGDADFTLIYWPSIDTILHERYRDEALSAEIEFIELFVRQLIKRMPKGTRLYVLSDHGLTLCRQRYLLPTVGPHPPVGGGRVAFYKDVSLDEVEEEIKRRGIPADVHELKELEYFRGRISPRCYENYGNVIVIAREHVCFRYPFEKEEKQGLGSHGGPSSEERIISLWEYTKTTQ